MELENETIQISTFVQTLSLSASALSMPWLRGSVHGELPLDSCTNPEEKRKCCCAYTGNTDHGGSRRGLYTVSQWNLA